MKFHESNEFKELQHEWYQRLKDEGFKDVEACVDGMLYLRQRSRPNLNPEKLEYFQALSYFVNIETFENEVDEFVLIRRADGFKIKDISIEMRQMNLPRYHRESIRYTIRKYEMKWGIKFYKPSQLSFKREPSGK